MKALALMVLALVASACGSPCYDGSIRYPGCGAAPTGWAAPRIGAQVEDVDLDQAKAVADEVMADAAAAQECLGAPLGLDGTAVYVRHSAEEVQKICNDVTAAACAIPQTSGGYRIFLTIDAREFWGYDVAHELGHVYLGEHFGDDDGSHRDGFWFGRDNGQYGGVPQDTGSVSDCAQLRVH